jgi:cephalosporin hydroxylase
VDGGALRDGEYYAGLDHEELSQWMLDAGLTDVGASLSCFPDTDPQHGDGAHDIYVVGTKPGVVVPAITPGVKPLTIVSNVTEISVEAMAQRVLETRERHGELLQQYHEAWYNAEHTWHYTHFLGVGLMKCPNDLWVYQDLLTNNRPKTVIETGTYLGGSALYFAYLMDMLQIEGGRVFTIDFEDRRRCDHPRITFLGGDSTDPFIAEAIAEQIEYPLLVSLDADHSAAHVYKELTLYAPLVKPGDWLVVEDTNIAWGGPDGDRGARGGLEDYVREHEGEFRQDILSERYLLSMNPGGWLQRVAECAHG